MSNRIINIDKILLRRGNTVAISNYTGPKGELVMDTSTNSLYLQDGEQAGGYLIGGNLSAIIEGYSGTIAGPISVPGGITSTVFIGDGSQLTGMYGNANVEAYFATVNSNITANLVNFGNNVATLGAPVAGGATDKLRLWDFGNTNPSGFNYAIGAEGNHVWFGMDVNSDAGGFKFYSQDNLLFKIGGAGTLTLQDGSQQTTAYLGANVGYNQQLGTGDDVEFASVAANIREGAINTGVNIPASENQIYVAKNGSDDNDGTINSPFLTIKAALDYAGTISAPAGVSVQVAPGIYHEENPVTIPPKVSLMGDNLRNVTVIPNYPESDLFYVTNGCYVWGITIKDYLANGFSFDPGTPTQNVFVSPYIQNLTSSTTTGTAVYIDGSLNSEYSTKAMIVGFFTIINRGGKGVHIVNSGYSQLVNIYTIACDVGIKVESGAFCTLNGSDCSIGNYGLWAEGMGSLQTTGQTVGDSTAGSFVIGNLTPNLPRVNTVMMIDGDPNIYNIDIITPINDTTATVTVQETYPSTLSAGTNVSFYYRSAIVASAHTFEYVGAGTNPATALPQYGGIPVEANEVVQIGGGKVTYTSTDHKGNFKIGSNLTINQGTGTITGDAFNRSLFALMTPYILALEI